jgi:hypothetical protein
MVVPVEEISRVTHMLEGLLELAGDDNECRQERCG